MPKGSKPKLIQNVFEARFEQGYRYLDRCGETMVILEDTLPEVSNHAMWMPQEMTPTGARIKCPECDLVVVFDTAKLCIDQNPADVECPFIEIAKYILTTLVSKFDIHRISRFGNRRKLVLPADSIEEAEALSVAKAPNHAWPTAELDGMKPRMCDATTTLETEDRSKGIRFCIEVIYRIEAPVHLDPLLLRPPHLLKVDQHKVLLDQMKRQAQREKSPVAGLQLDIDYWWLNPDEPDADVFLRDSDVRMTQMVDSFMGERK